MKAIVINFNSNLRFCFDKHDEVDGLFAISIPFVSISFWSREANKLLCTATRRTFKNKEFIVKDSVEWHEKFNDAVSDYKEKEEKKFKSDIRNAWDTINKHNSRINELETENRKLRDVIKICGDNHENN